VNTSPDDAAAIARFNALGDGEARTLLASCLAVPRWIEELATGRPYASVGALVATAKASASALTEVEVAAALARHPRIGERARAGHDAEFSIREQSGVDQGDRAVATALLRGNHEYEERFGRVFLIRAAGRSSDEILAELERRLGNSETDEIAEVVTQLSEIAVLRLEQSVRSDPSADGSR